MHLAYAAIRCTAWQVFPPGASAGPQPTARCCRRSGAAAEDGASSDSAAGADDVVGRSRGEVRLLQLTNCTAVGNTAGAHGGVAALATVPATVRGRRSGG